MRYQVVKTGDALGSGYRIIRFDGALIEWNGEEWWMVVPPPPEYIPAPKKEPAGDRPIEDHENRVTRYGPAIAVMSGWYFERHPDGTVEIAVPAGVRKGLFVEGQWRTIVNHLEEVR